MKKRLLITSIVMMLVVAVALSTATYAWFTSNASVTASTVTMTAATNEDGALAIGWTEDTLGTAITGEFNGGTLSPMAPTAYTVGSSGTAPSSIVFNTATIKSVSGTMQFGEPDDEIVPYTWNDGAGGHTSFHVKNLATAGAVNVKITATLGEAAADLARVAIFIDGKLQGIIANNVAAGSGTSVNDVVYYTTATGDTVALTGNGTDSIPANSYVRAKVAVGTITEADPVASFPTQDAVTSITYSLAANTDSVIVVKTWLDGALFDETRSTQTATVALTFAATRA